MHGGGIPLAHANHYVVKHKFAPFAARSNFYNLPVRHTKCLSVFRRHMHMTLCNNNALAQFHLTGRAHQFARARAGHITRTAHRCRNADAAGICLKSGNACVLRGGSLAARSCAAIAHVLHDAAVSAGMPAGCIGIIESTDRAAADVLMGLRGVVDVLVPRGGAGLIAHCVDCAKGPVIETGTGNCHVYVHSTADFDMARNIVVNAKCRRYGVCNACETLLVDQSVAERFLPELFGMLADKGVRIHGDELACKAALAAGEKRLPTDAALQVERASEQDWETEYLSPDLAVRCVSGPEQAIAHINRYGTMHSEAIVADPKLAEGAAAIERFVNEVDAAAVYVNASTAFTDGGMFGLGAEIGISTQKLHVRGPFALEGLTSYKYVLRGSGQVRA